MSRERLSLRCDCTPVVDLQYDIGDVTPTAAVVDAVSAAAGVDPTRLDPLHDRVDPEALDRLFGRGSVGVDGSESVLSLTVADWNVFVRDDGRVRVCDPSGPSDPGPVFD